MIMRVRKTMQARVSSPRWSRLHVEPLEDRRVMATITVTALTDGTLAQLAGDGQISLREAFEAANTNVSVDGSAAGHSSGRDLIEFQPGLNGTVFLTAGALVSTAHVDVNAPLSPSAANAITINAGSQSRIFEFTPAQTSIIRNLTLTNGRSAGDSQAGGAVYAFGHLTLEHVTITNSRTLGVGAPGGAVKADKLVVTIASVISGNFTVGHSSSGGGVFANELTLRDSAVSGNRTSGAQSPGGGIYATDAYLKGAVVTDNWTQGDFSHGGGVYAYGNTHLFTSHVTDNETQGDQAHGGGIRARLATILGSSDVSNNRTFGFSSDGGGVSALELEIQHSRLSGNVTNGLGSGGGGMRAQNVKILDAALVDNSTRGDGSPGGAIFVGIWQDQGVLQDALQVARTTISGNFTGGNDSVGGAIFTFAPVQLVNSTVSGNSTSGLNAHGGGIYASPEEADAALTLTYTTIFDNHALVGQSHGGGIHPSAAGLQLKSSIVAGNSAGGMGPDLLGDAIAADHSFIADKSGTILNEANPAPDANGNIIGGPNSGLANPWLGSLADYGGPTETHRPSLLSPVRDAGDPAATGPLPATDQRGAGYKRTWGPAVDMGSFEWNMGGGFALVSSFNGSGVLSGVFFQSSDLLSYNAGHDRWSMYFDASDVGLAGVNVDAHHREDDGSILLSVDAPVTLPGIGDILNTDIVRFIPTSLGEVTRGTYEIVLRGGSAGLIGARANIDAIGRTPAGRLILSTTDPISISSSSFDDEDLLQLNDGNVLELYFDGSDVELNDSSEDVAGVWFEPDTGFMFLTTLGGFDVPGATGDTHDVLGFVPESLGTTTRGEFRLFQLPDLNLPAALAIDGVDLQISNRPLATIGNLVFGDVNANGIQDALENGIPGVRVSLLDAAGNALSTTSTDEAGEYLFMDLAPGDYQVKFDRPAEFRFSPRDQGGDDAADSDAHRVTGLTDVISLGANEVNVSVDAGLVWRIRPAEFLPATTLRGSHTLTETATSAGDGYKHDDHRDGSLREATTLVEEEARPDRPLHRETVVDRAFAQFDFHRREDRGTLSSSRQVTNPIVRGIEWDADESWRPCDALNPFRPVRGSSYPPTNVFQG
jgi:hypothetical protein